MEKLIWPGRRINFRLPVFPGIQLTIKHSLLSACLVVVLLLSACGPSQVVEESTPTPLPTPVIPTKPVYTVQRGEITRKMALTGRVGPVVATELYFKIGGRVDEVMVKTGDQVKTGQLLARLEGQVRESDLRRAEINLEQANLHLQLAEIQTPKYAKEYPIVIDLRKYEVELAQLALDDLKQGIEDTQIIAPFDGTILTVFTSPDTLADAYRPVIEMADLNNLEVRSEPTTDQLQQLSEGLPVSVWPVSGGAKSIEGTIRKLPYPYGKAAPGSEAEKDDTSTHVALLQPLASIGLEMGSVVRIEINLESRADILWLPIQAIRKYQGREFVLVQDGEGQRRVDVKVGISSEDRVEVVEGLTEGQTVVAP